MSSRGLHWVRPPRQTRSEETLQRILDAAAELVADKGFEDTSVAELVRRAGSSVGAFYTRFPDKDALLYGLYERWLEEATATAEAALATERWDGASVPEIVEAVVAFLVEIYRERRGLLRAFALRHHTDPEFQARQQRLSHTVNQRLAELLLSRRGELRHPDPERAALFGLTTVFSVLENVILFDDFRAARLTLPDSELAAELTRLYLAYLGIGLPDLRDGSPSSQENSR